jgi:hypothetical protein
MDMDLEARAIAVGDLQGEGCLESASQARDGRKGDLVVQGRGGREEPPDLLHTAHGWERVCGVSAQKCEGVPVTLEDVWREAAQATGAEAQGSWGKAMDVCAVQQGVLQRLCSKEVG